MNTYNITIPKSLAQMGDLMLVPRKEYESLLVLRKYKEYTPTLAEKRALKRARLNREKGNYLTIDELRKKLDFTS